MSCNCNNKLMGNLMGALMLPDGATFRIGMNITPDRVPDVPADVEGCLYNTGAFWEVSASIPNADDWFSVHPYLVIQGRTATAFADSNDLKNLIVGQLQAGCALSVISVNAVDNLVIDSIPQEYVGQAGAQQPNYNDSNVTPQNNNSGNPNQSAKCDWNKLSFGDYIACETGFTKTTGMIAVVALLLVGVVALKR